MEIHFLLIPGRHLKFAFSSPSYLDATQAQKKWNWSYGLSLKLHLTSNYGLWFTLKVRKLNELARKSFTRSVEWEIYANIIRSDVIKKKWKKVHLFFASKRDINKTSTYVDCAWLAQKLFLHFFRCMFLQMNSARILCNFRFNRKWVMNLITSRRGRIKGNFGVVDTEQYKWKLTAIFLLKLVENAVFFGIYFCQLTNLINKLPVLYFAKSAAS